MRKFVFVGSSIALASVAASATISTNWSWLFPIVGLPAAGDPQDRKAYRISGSEQSFSDMEIHDLRHAVDWFPSEHPAMPTIVSAGHDKANACGYCHSPDGNGRPENSSLAGLPADYIKRQVAAFAEGSRRSALASAVPVRMMIATAKATTRSDVDEAADYFSNLHYTSHVRVVETSELSFRPDRFVYVLSPGARQPLGDRIIEVPVDPKEFEKRDPHTKYAAFVPLGSIAAGRALTQSGGPAAQRCAMCHGEGLRGGIALRSPDVRRLLSFVSLQPSKQAHGQTPMPPPCGPSLRSWTPRL